MCTYSKKKESLVDDNTYDKPNFAAAKVYAQKAIDLGFDEGYCLMGEIYQYNQDDDNLHGRIGRLVTQFMEEDTDEETSENEIQ